MAKPRGESANQEYKEQRFVDELLTNGFRMRDAALAAGYSEANAHVEASKMIRRKRVRAKLREHFDKAGAARQDAVELLASMVFGMDPADYEEYLTDYNVTLRSLRENGVDTRMIKKIKRKESGEVEIEWYDRMAAYDRLAKLCGWNEDEGSDDGAITITTPMGPWSK